MRERTSSEIVIHTMRNGSAYAMTVPITSQSKRKFQLMAEDSVTLVFTLDEPHRFVVGDYIEDPIFGLYAIREEQMPAYNQATGGYDYTLRLDAAYWMFENHVFMLTYEHEGTYSRVETKWCLTGTLEEHVGELMHNVEVLSDYGLLHTVQWAYDISTAEKKGEARFLSYDGVHILSALNMLADEYECEWWVTHEDDTYTLHMGKCGGDGEPEYEMELGKNVETMGISRNQNTFANKLYVLGGTKNIPESYGRKLILNIDQASGETFRDSQKIITPSMLLDEGVYQDTSKFFGAMDMTAQNSNCYDLTAEINLGTMEDGDSLTWTGVGVDAEMRVSPGLFLRLIIDARLVLYKDGAELAVVSTGSFSDLRRTDTAFGGKQIVGISISLDDGQYKIETDIAESAAYKLVLFATITSDVNISRSFDGATGRVGVNGGRAYQARVRWDGNEYYITFNPNYLRDGEDAATYFTFNDGTPQGFGIGEEVELLDYDPVDIKLEWYTEDIDDPSSLLKILERRLHLPTRIGGEYISMDGYIIKADKANWSSERIVESLVTNESIYPKLYLRVVSISTRSEVDRVKYGDNSYRDFSWDAYYLTVEQISGDPFPLITRFITKGEKLQVMFLSDLDTEKAYREVYNGEIPASRPIGDYLLAGMTFDCEFSDSEVSEGMDLSEAGYYALNGTIVPSDNAKHTPKTAIGRFKRLVYSTHISNQGLAVAFFDENNQLLSDISVPGQTGGVSGTIDLTDEDYEDVRYVSISYYDLEGEYADYKGFLAYGDKTYKIIRSEDYGAKLPNEILHPSVGDVLVLTGWNVSALSSLGLIDIAEQNLFNFAEEYLDAIEEGQFVFDCHMMSDWPFCVFGQDHEGSEDNPWGWIPMDVVNGSQVAINPYKEYWTKKEQGEGHLYFYVRNENYYVMPREGTRVRIIHGSLPEGEKVSRVIGYEFKLDKPYDSPTYTIGETDAYSRLKKIERQLNKM